MVCAQTYDELLSENELLRHRIEALETRFEERAINHRSLIDWQEEHHEHAHDEHDHHHEHSHDHGDHGLHADEVCYDYIYPYESHGRGEPDAHGHSGHTSIEGYPFLHGIRVEIDFIERALELDLGTAQGANGGMVDETEFEAELVWALNSRMVFIFGVPMAYLDPVEEFNTAGVGDLEIGMQFLAFGGERDLLFFALFAGVPTGDEDRDLGSGHATLEPTALWLHDFGGGSYFQSRYSWEIPLSTDDESSELHYDMGLYHTFLSTAEYRHFRYLTAAFETNGTTLLNGSESGDTVLDLTIGTRWVVREMDEVGFGWSFPVTGSQDFENLFILSYRRHF